MKLSGWPGPRGAPAPPGAHRLGPPLRHPNHQGILARRGSYVYRDLGALLDDLARLTGPALLVAADSLTDPMNLGNLCRSAFGAGAHGLIIPKDRAAGVTRWWPRPQPGPWNTCRSTG